MYVFYTDVSRSKIWDWDIETVVVFRLFSRNHFTLLHPRRSIDYWELNLNLTFKIWFQNFLPYSYHISWIIIEIIWKTFSLRSRKVNGWNEMIIKRKIIFVHQHLLTVVHWEIKLWQKTLPLVETILLVVPLEESTVTMEVLP